MTTERQPLDIDTRSDEQIDVDNEAWQAWWDTATPCERRLWDAQVHIRYLQGRITVTEQDRDTLRQQLAAATEALALYANEENWAEASDFSDGPNWWVAGYGDNGLSHDGAAVARAALAASQEP